LQALRLQIDGFGHFGLQKEAHLNGVKEHRSNPAKEIICNDTINSKKETAENLCIKENSSSSNHNISKRCCPHKHAKKEIYLQNC